MSKTEILFSFDTEDFTTERNADAILGLAQMLTEEGVTGHFAVVGLVAQQLLAWGRQDVLKALEPHILGFHSWGHTIHPVLSEMSDIADYQEARRRVEAVESKGIELLHKAFGDKEILFAVPPGCDVAYTALYYYEQQGIPFYLGGYIHDDENRLIDYCSQTHIPYSTAIEGHLIIHKDRFDLNSYLDSLTSSRRLILYHHPNMGVKKTFWDALNYNGRNDCEFGHWKQPEDRPFAETITFWSDFRKLIRAIKNDDRFVITDIRKIMEERNRHLPGAITREIIPDLLQELEAKFGPTRRGPYCVSDVFYALAELLNGKASYIPGAVKGFLEAPVGIDSAVTVRRESIVAASRSISTGEFIPPQVDVDGISLGAADFLFAMGAALLSDDPEIELRPRTQQVSLKDYAELDHFFLKGRWLFSPDFQDEYMSKRLKLQNWTLREYGI